jgi:protein required for attachment to host cells
MKKTVTWILIANGAQARVVEHLGPGKGLRAVEGLDFAQPTLQAQDIVSDKPGRGFSSSGPARSAMEPRTDPVEHREAEFVKSTAERIARHHASGDFDRLVIAAAPIALGHIRKAMPNQLRDAVIAELDKDLTNIPTAQLDKHFDGIFAV